MTGVGTSRPPATDRFGRPLRDLRISVTDRCNFRCLYCRPPGTPSPPCLAPSRLLDAAQLARVAAAAADLGVHKIRLTGGEPLLRPDLPAVVRAVAGVDGVTDVALTTNGWRLAERAAGLAEAGLRRVTVSLDALDDRVFARMTGVGAPVSRVIAGIRSARAAGLNPVKLNAVIWPGVNEGQIVSLARFARDEGVVLRLIEHMDTGSARGGPGRPGEPRDPRRRAGSDALVAQVAAAFPLAPAAGAPEPGAVAVRYRYLDGQGELGVISAVSRPFCAGCTRLRLTADGRLLTCLFAAAGHEVREQLNSSGGTRLRARIDAVWRARTDRYCALRASGAVGRRRIEMSRVGG